MATLEPDEITRPVAVLDSTTLSRKSRSCTPVSKPTPVLSRTTLPEKVTPTASRTSTPPAVLSRTRLPTSWCPSPPLMKIPPPFGSACVGSHAQISLAVILSVIPAAGSAHSPVRAQCRISQALMNGDEASRVTAPEASGPAPAYSITQCSRTEPDWNCPSSSYCASTVSSVKKMLCQSPGAAVCGSTVTLVNTTGASGVPRAASAPGPSRSEPTAMAMPEPTRTSTPGSIVKVAPPPTRTLDITVYGLPVRSHVVSARIGPPTTSASAQRASAAARAAPIVVATLMTHLPDLVQVDVASIRIHDDRSATTPRSPSFS
jgi:hypothetical protein